MLNKEATRVFGCNIYGNVYVRIVELLTLLITRLSARLPTREASCGPPSLRLHPSWTNMRVELDKLTMNEEIRASSMTS